MDAHSRHCEVCKATVTGVQMLHSKRLGRHERRQLLEASTPNAPPSPIFPPDPTQAAQTATRRAIAKLVEHRLLKVDPEQLRLLPGEDDSTLKRLGRKYAVLRVASRTLLGEAVVQFYGSALEHGGRVRWIDHIDAVEKAALAACPDRAQ